MAERTVRSSLAHWLKANARLLLYAPALLAAGGFAAWASFTSLATLGVYVGFGSGRPWLLPAILDVAAYATTVAYMLRPNLARALVSGGFLAITAIGNAQAHYFNPASQDLVAPLEYAIAWGVAPPLVWFAVAHFTAFELHPEAFTHFWRFRQPAAAKLPKARTGKPPKSTTDPEPETASQTARRNSAGSSPESVAAWLTSQGYRPGDIGRAKLTELRPDITEHRAREVMAIWKAPSTNGTGDKALAV